MVATCSMIKCDMIKCDMIKCDMIKCNMCKNFSDSKRGSAHPS